MFNVFDSFSFIYLLIVITFWISESVRTDIGIMLGSSKTKSVDACLRWYDGWISQSSFSRCLREGEGLCVCAIRWIDTRKEWLRFFSRRCLRCADRTTTHCTVRYWPEMPFNLAGKRPGLGRGPWTPAPMSIGEPTTRFPYPKAGAPALCRRV